MKATKTIQSGITNITKTKKDILDQEYDNLQKYLQENKDIELCSANKQQADRYYKKSNKIKNIQSPSEKT